MFDLIDLGNVNILLKNNSEAEALNDIQAR